jgi:hypothetical protein
MWGERGRGVAFSAEDLLSINMNCTHSIIIENDIFMENP